MAKDDPFELARRGLESDYQAALTQAQPIGNTDDLDRLFERMIAEAEAAAEKALDAAP
jgi:hypothetical protein